MASGSTGSVPRLQDREISNELGNLRSIIDEMEADLGRLERAAQGPGATPVQQENFRTAAAIYPPEMDRRKRLVEELEARQITDDKLRFADAKVQDEYETRDALLQALRGLDSSAKRIEARLAATRSLHEVTLLDAKAAWDEAIASINNRSLGPLYDGLVIRPQLGLVPLRRDESTGRWEFWHVLSGERPTADATGRWKLGPESGIILILIPGGEAVAGAQREDVTKARFDADASPRERLRRARLDPYFVAKYELTQGQVLFITDRYFSSIVVGMQPKDTPRVTRLNPVESIDWVRSNDLLESVGLVLPTELQWEFAARAGGTGRFGKSDDFDAVRPLVNYSDSAVAKNSRNIPSAPGEDGYYAHAPVDAFGPNAFGLHAVLGNVSEWCRDSFEDDLGSYPPRGGDGLAVPKLMTRRSVRGGSYLGLPTDQRLSARRQFAPLDSRPDVGVRAARALE